MKVRSIIVVSFFALRMLIKYGEMTPKEKNNYSARQVDLKPFCFF
jgi:hypothetical protein